MPTIQEVITQMVEAGESENKIQAVISSYNEKKARDEQAAKEKAYYDQLYKQQQEANNLKKEKASEEDATAEQEVTASPSEDGSLESQPLETKPWVGTDGTFNHIPLENFVSDGGWSGTSLGSFFSGTGGSGD